MIGFKWISRLVLLLLFLTSSVFADTPPATTTAQQKIVADFLNEAMAYIKQNGKAQALKAFNDQKSNFYRPAQGLYISAFETNIRNSAISLANGRDPQLAGKNRYSDEDKLGHYFVRKVLTACKAGGGWVSYYEKNPQRDMTVEQKWTYTMPVDDTWCIDAGFYVTDETNDEETTSANN